jgi:hypothetical protein
MTTNCNTGDGTEVVYTFAKNAFQEVWAYREPYMEHDLVHLKVFKVGKDGHTMSRTKAGLSINVRLLPELANAVSALQEAVGEPEQQ